MDNKEKISGSQDNGGAGVTPEDQSLGSASNGGKPAENEVKTKKSKPKSNKGTKPKEKPSNGEVQSKKEMEPQVMVALIGAIVTIVVTMINSQAIVGWLFKPDPTPTIIPTAISSPTLFISDTPTFSITDTSIPVITPSITGTPTISITSTDIPATVTPGAKMEVYLYANKTTGKAPLKVKLDARDSYLREPNGTKFPCRGGTCYYTWKVYANGTQLGKAVTDSGGTFEYSFGKKGVYMVTVYICRGRDRIDCGGSGSQIVAN